MKLSEDIKQEILNDLKNNIPLKEIFLKNLTSKASFKNDSETLSVSGDDIMIEYCERLVLAL